VERGERYAGVEASHWIQVKMPIGGSNKAQKEVVNKKAKGKSKELDDEDKAFKAKQQADKKAAAEYAAGLKKKGK